MDDKAKNEVRKRILGRSFVLADSQESTKQAFIEEILKIIPNAEITIDSKNRVRVGIKK
jgi:hypothetical protein